MKIKHRPAFYISGTFDIDYPFHFCHLVVFYVCSTIETMFTLYDCLFLPLFLSLSSLSPLREYSHTCLRSTIVHGAIGPFLGSCMCLCMHVCIYLYLIGVSWPSLVWGVPAVWLSVDRRGRHTFSVSSSLKFPRQLNDMSLYWLHGYIDILLENTLKTAWHLSDLSVTMASNLFGKNLPKVSPTFVVSFFFFFNNIFRKYWISLWLSYTRER